MLDEKRLIKDCQKLLSQATYALNQERNYRKCYDLATQAEYISENYLSNLALLIEGKLLKGLSLLGIDTQRGHDYLEGFYFNNKEHVNLCNTIENNLGIRVLWAYAMSKTSVNEYGEGIGLLVDVIKECQKRIDILKSQNKPYEWYMRKIINTMNQIAFYLIYLSRESVYPVLIATTEKEVNALPDLGAMDLKELSTKLNISKTNQEVNNELSEAMRYLNDAQKLAEEFNFDDLLTITQINKACVLVEMESYKQALKLLDKLSENELVKKYYKGHVLNELAITKINLGDFTAIEDLLETSWDWLSQHQFYDELSRTCYALGLYHFKQGNLSMAYSYADLSNRQKSELPTVRLLYQVSLLKYISANREGNEKEYVLFRSENDKYREQLERRG